MDRLDSSLFTFSAWRSGCLADLGVATKFHDIIAFRHRIRNAAFGYTDGSCVPCRPKSDTVAVALWTGEYAFWTHFTLKEFETVFGDLI
jgi:hypothetical protein